MTQASKNTPALVWPLFSSQGAPGPGSERPLIEKKNGAAMPTAENDQDDRSFFNHPVRGSYFAAYVYSPARAALVTAV